MFWERQRELLKFKAKTLDSNLSQAQHDFSRTKFRVKSLSFFKKRILLHKTLDVNSKFRFIFTWFLFLRYTSLHLLHLGESRCQVFLGFANWFDSNRTGLTMYTLRLPYFSNYFNNDAKTKKCKHRKCRNDHIHIRRSLETKQIEAVLLLQ